MSTTHVNNILTQQTYINWHFTIIKTCIACGGVGNDITNRLRCDILKMFTVWFKFFSIQNTYYLLVGFRWNCSFYIRFSFFFQQHMTIYRKEMLQIDIVKTKTTIDIYLIYNDTPQQYLDRNLFFKDFSIIFIKHGQFYRCYCSRKIVFYYQSC